MRILFAGMLALLVIGCSASGSESGSPGLTITSHQSGQRVDTADITVSGTAPAGGRVVRDISFAPDDEVIAGTDGRWSMRVELDSGANELTFRLGDDEETALKLGLTYDSTTAVSPDEPETTDPEEPEGEATAKPTRSARLIGQGTWEVGVEVKPGTYRTRVAADGCYWARLKGFDGSLGDIIANDIVSGYGIVTISKKDEGFETRGCPDWSSDLSRVTSSKTKFGDGTYMIATDIQPGRYKASGGDACYYARLKGFGGTLDQIISNNLSVGGRVVVTIKAKDKGFVTRGCGTWSKS